MHGKPVDMCISRGRILTVRCYSLSPLFALVSSDYNLDYTVQCPLNVHIHLRSLYVSL